MHFGYRDDPCSDCIEQTCIDGQVRWVCTMNCGPSLSPVEDPSPSYVMVAYVDSPTGWSATMHDCQGNQIGDACFEYRKTDAEFIAKMMAGWSERDSRALPIHVHKKSGALMRIDQPARG